ncbi:MAG: imidazole glycerol phosphate synthase subunit HisF [Ignavibacteria bacterium GWB2_35_12]|nr:MAG: imidazole glycerol phosphate synthase subunit HisF [Ignavibacteria bacterium GWA2_35_8]OGU39533.1 MAG: imidazole glycerol phosphate synthase subunit HisF [Ignavibacteria bacterium GWB2_35_12]OGU90195.1 MAG: imidazole glycerol phosphate synthase subunit HisF [Ignavibacteria bacterium RIFOXYA2_FULL_35_10]OGU93601.1 MAG: imidazole glycerol phosphate synthase subunit HisF [Ignavibacteria bacterium RIFOXYB2_FULL_36_7]OGV21935.1 MAG: imidazole glycerol phosphate synthase subunit HisF [Ignavib
MLKTRVIPCLLLKEGGFVKTARFSKPRYLGDPRNIVRLFNEKEVDEIVILDIDATRDKRKPYFDLVRDIVSEAFMPIGYGGGITTIEDIKLLFKIGVEKVVINTQAVNKPEFISEASERFGSQSIVASIDVKKNLFGKYKVCIESGRKKCSVSPVEHAKAMEDSGAGEIIINSIDRDGTMEGYDIELIKSVASNVSIPVIALGGASKLEHFRDAVNSGASAVSAGSMFVYQGVHKAVLINYPTQDELKGYLV